MKLEYDEQKSRRNENERGLPFSVAKNFEFDTAFIEQDIRFEYRNLVLKQSDLSKSTFCDRFLFKKRKLPHY
ncbi:Uncharacterised protein [Actinobacillus pleuropneumoniae]|nr:Uncharacterised protein [Actinobacillus pleuropneumoniae]